MSFVGELAAAIRRRRVVGDRGVVFFFWLESKASKLFLLLAINSVCDWRI